MKKIIFIILILSLFLIACEQRQIVKVTCNKPYILVGTSCCLDKDDNSICDKYESTQKDQEDGESVQALPHEVATSEKIYSKSIYQALKSVVTIESKYTWYNPETKKDETIERGGSGFIVSEDGFVLTNQHVVGNVWEKGERKAYTIDKKEYELEFIASFEDWDMAVLKINEPNKKFDYLEISPRSGKIGDLVHVLGSPLSENFTVTKGIISQKNRRSYLSGNKTYSKYLQTDASINFGNSGGAIINEEGMVVGMATYAFKGWSVEGLGYALQSETIKDLYENKVYKNITFLRERTTGHNIYSKDIEINRIQNVRVYTDQKKKETKFSGFKIEFKNNKNEDVSLYYHLMLIGTDGVINYNKNLKEYSHIGSSSIFIEDYNDNILIKSTDKANYYKIDVFDLHTREHYGYFYGLGTLVVG